MIAEHENKKRKLPFETLLILAATGFLVWGVFFYVDPKPGKALIDSMAPLGHVSRAWIALVAPCTLLAASIGTRIGYYIRDRVGATVFYAEGTFDAFKKKLALDYGTPLTGLIVGALIGCYLGMLLPLYLQDKESKAPSYSSSSNYSNGNTAVSGSPAVSSGSSKTDVKSNDSSAVKPSTSDVAADDIVKLGKWMGHELTWHVIDRQGSRVMLMLAEARLDNMPYNNELKPVTWEACTLRLWLNGEFYEKAFSASEKKRILEVTVPADRNPACPNIEPGKDTKDRVFLLSIPEYEKLVKAETLRFFREPGKNEGEGWWLRSPGGGTGNAARVYDFGSLDSLGNFVDSVHAVRPALWINLES